MRVGCDLLVILRWATWIVVALRAATVPHGGRADAPVQQGQVWPQRSIESCRMGRVGGRYIK
jgi:hypothetical protein